MSDFTVIGDVGETLKKLLDDDPWSGITPKPEITFKSPKEIKDDGGSTNKVSLFLYQILENPHLRNQEPLRVNDSHLQHAAAGVGPARTWSRHTATTRRRRNTSSGR